MGRRRFAWISLVYLCLLASLPAGALGGDLLIDSGQRLGNEVTWSVALGDVDRDGDLDAVAANFDAGAIVWLNDGTGHFVDSGQRLAAGVYVALADFDLDGALDALLGSWDVPVGVWWNDGTGTFLQGRRLASVAGCMALGVGDLNGDGLPDVYVGTDTSDRVFLNAGDRAFADSGQRLGRAPTGGVALGDMDGDGDCDVVAAGWDQLGVVWGNDGSGRLSPLCSFEPTDLHVHGAALADYEGDGDLDAFFAVAGDRCCYNVWRNDGTGSLAPIAFDLGSALQQGIAVEDLNLDGYLDVVLAVGAGGTPMPSTVWLGQDSALVDSGLRIGEGFAGGVATGDLDGDGDTDLFIGFLSLRTGWDYLPLPNQVWINTTNE